MPEIILPPGGKPPGPGGPAPMEMQTQRQRVYAKIMDFAAGKVQSDGIEVFKQAGDHHRHFIKVKDGNDHFIFYTAVVSNEEGNLIIPPSDVMDYDHVRELRMPKSLHLSGDFIQMSLEARMYLSPKDIQVNNALLSIALTAAREQKVTELPTEKLLHMLRDANILPLK